MQQRTEPVKLGHYRNNPTLASGLALCYNPQFLGLPPRKLHVCLIWLQAVCVFEMISLVLA